MIGSAQHSMTTDRPVENDRRDLHDLALMVVGLRKDNGIVDSGSNNSSRGGRIDMSFAEDRIGGVNVIKRKASIINRDSWEICNQLVLGQHHQHHRQQRPLPHPSKCRELHQLTAKKIELRFHTKQSGGNRRRVATYM